MIVRPKVQKLILRLRNPDRVKALIPTARTITYKGVDLVAIPHRLDEVKMLTNLGFTPPHPVDYYYDWPGRYAPMKAQRDTVRFLTMNNRAYCLNDMGTGKTLSTLWAFDYLRSIGKAKRMLAIAPLSTLERTWGDEVFKHFPHLSHTVLHGTRTQRIDRLERSEAEVLIINHDGVRIILNELNARDDIDLVVIDELSQVARNHTTDRWKVLYRLLEGREIAWGLTGTPTPNAPTDAFAQCKLLTPSTVPSSLTTFRMQTMTEVWKYNWKPKPDALETVSRAMQPAIRVKREDCIDLPPVMYETREVVMTKSQQQAYKEMEDDLYTQYKGGEITAANAAVKMSKLIQIVSGAAYDAEGDTIVIPPKARIQETLDLIQEAPSKAIVFVPFKSALKVVNDAISKHYSTAIICGETSSAQRSTIFGDFQSATDPHVLIAQPAAMSHGVTLTAASVIIWFAPVTSAETYEQANARINRPGQKHSQLIAHIQSSDVEKKLYARLKDKTERQSNLLTLFAEMR